jgi:hypothetical protein
MFAASAVVVASSTTPFPEGGSAAAKVLHDSTLRVAPSGIFRVEPVDNVNPVDKSGRCWRLFDFGACRAFRKRNFHAREAAWIVPE